MADQAVSDNVPIQCVQTRHKRSNRASQHLTFRIPISTIEGAESSVLVVLVGLPVGATMLIND